MTLTRRALFKGMGASLLMAPSIVRASSLDYVPRERRTAKTDWTLVDGVWRRGFHTDGTAWVFIGDSGAHPFFNAQSLTPPLPHA